MSGDHAPEPNLGSSGPPRQPQQPAAAPAASDGGGGSGFLNARNLGIIGVVLALVAGFIVFGPGQEAQAAELRLEPIGFTGENPFTASVGDGEEIEVEVEIPPAATPGANVSVPAATPGLYGGTNENACDQEQLKAFLAENAEKAAAWAEVQGIEVGEIPAFIDSLTPVLLRADTAVLNHGFRGGTANQIDAVLKAGTAVLVDEKGQPVAKCACGNPLAAPRAVQEDVKLVGEPWPDFDLTVVVVIQPAPQPLVQIEVYNIITNNITIVVPGNPTVTGGTPTPEPSATEIVPTDAPTATPPTPEVQETDPPTVDDPTGVYDVTVTEECVTGDGSVYNCDGRGGTYTATVTIECQSETACTVTIDRNLPGLDPVTGEFAREGGILRNSDTETVECFVDGSPVTLTDNVEYRFFPDGTGTASSVYEATPTASCPEPFSITSSRTFTLRTT